MNPLRRWSRHPSLLSALLAAAALTLVLTSPAAAQSGSGASAPLSTGYDLIWFTVDGGGHTWSTGGGYALGGSIGQPDAQIPVAGAGFSLQGGFLHGRCAPVAVHVVITCDGVYARLAWTPDAANMAYDIYRFTSPYLAPDPANKVGTDSTGLWSDPMPNTCRDTAINYTYQVRSTCIGAHADANVVAEFDFALAPGSGP